MARPLWFVTLLKKSFPGRRRLAQMTRYPLLGRLTEYMLFEGDDMVYLAKDGVIPVGVDLNLPDNVVLPSQVVSEFIAAANYHWIMDRCFCRDATTCADFPLDLGCLFLGAAVEHMDPRLGRRVTREEALTHVEKCREAGLVHLIGRNKLDVVWTGGTPGDRLLTICNCCPCCCLWRMLPDIHQDIAQRVTKMPGVYVQVTEDCQGCGLCAEDLCFVNAIQMVDDRAWITDMCRGCGRCVEFCPAEAIELIVKEEDFVQQTIERIRPLVDVT